MNERHRKRQLARRRAHSQEAKLVASLQHRASYPAVKQGHIVPKCYQQSFAVNDQVAVHIDGARDPVLMNIRDAATRSKYWT